MNRWLGGFWMTGVGAAVLLGACLPTTSDVGRLEDAPGGQGGEGPHDASGGTSSTPSAGTTSMPGAGTMNQPGECRAGETRPAGDGCNSCSCSEEGSWLCTEIGCACTEGETVPAGDGCNTCTCFAGQWGCTLRDCETCTVGEISDDGCTSCVCTDFGEGPRWACTLNECACRDGEERPADDGCGVCRCDGGQWQCQDIACETCEEGDTKRADDGCNNCTCSEGQWQCTLVDCQPPVCDDGFADCDADSAVHCETEVESDPLNCGRCGNYCNFPGATAACVEGECVIDACDAGYEDCNGDAQDGCEVPVSEGGCATRCDVPDDAPDAVPSPGGCDCPEGTTCVIGSIFDADGQYCVPLPEACPGYGTCACLATCVCPDDTDLLCREEMAVGGKMNVYCNSESGVPF